MYWMRGLKSHTFKWCGACNRYDSNKRIWYGKTASGACCALRVMEKDSVCEPLWWEHVEIAWFYEPLAIISKEYWDMRAQFMLSAHVNLVGQFDAEIGVGGFPYADMLQLLKILDWTGPWTSVHWLLHSCKRLLQMIAPTSFAQTTVFMLQRSKLCSFETLGCTFFLCCSMEGLLSCQCNNRMRTCLSWFRCAFEEHLIISEIQRQESS